MQRDRVSAKISFAAFSFRTDLLLLFEYDYQQSITSLLTTVQFILIGYFHFIQYVKEQSVRDKNVLHAIL